MDNYFDGLGMVSQNLRSLSPKEANELLSKEAVLVDVREEFMTHIKTFNIENQLNIPITQLIKSTKDLPTNKPLIFADATGVKSKAAYDLAILNGITNIANLAGGLVEWERQGLPTTTYQKIKVSGKNKCEFVNKNHIESPEP